MVIIDGYISENEGIGGGTLCPSVVLPKFILLLSCWVTAGCCHVEEYTTSLVAKRSGKAVRSLSNVFGNDDRAALARNVAFMGSICQRQVPPEREAQVWPEVVEHIPFLPLFIVM